MMEVKKNGYHWEISFPNKKNTEVVISNTFFWFPIGKDEARNYFNKKYLYGWNLGIRNEKNILDKNINCLEDAVEAAIKQLNKGYTFNTINWTVSYKVELGLTLS